MIEAKPIKTPEKAFKMQLNSAEAPKARNVIARGKREARHPGIVFQNETEAL